MASCRGLRSAGLPRTAVSHVAVASHVDGFDESSISRRARRRKAGFTQSLRAVTQFAFVNATANSVRVVCRKFNEH